MANHPIQPLEQRYAPEQIATLKITGLTDSVSQGSWLSRHLTQLNHDGSSSGHINGKTGYTLQVAPVTDLNDLANQIDFGVASLQVDSRTIAVEVDAAKLEALLAADPSYHLRNTKPKARATAGDVIQPAN